MRALQPSPSPLKGTTPPEVDEPERLPERGDGASAPVAFQREKMAIFPSDPSARLPLV